MAQFRLTPVLVPVPVAPVSGYDSVTNPALLMATDFEQVSAKAYSQH